MKSIQYVSWEVDTHKCLSGKLFFFQYKMFCLYGIAWSLALTFCYHGSEQNTKTPLTMNFCCLHNVSVFQNGSRRWTFTNNTEKRSSTIVQRRLQYPYHLLYIMKQLLFVFSTVSWSAKAWLIFGIRTHQSDGLILSPLHTRSPEKWKSKYLDFLAIEAWKLNLYPNICKRNMIFVGTGDKGTRGNS